MCGRITQQLTSDEIARLFGAEDEVADPGGHFNVAPTQHVDVVLDSDSHRVVTRLRWGLVPSWAADPSIGSRLINARAEGVAEKPSFRSSFRRHRCIVPADSFYEWERAGSTKVPYVIGKRDGSPLALAGLWASWRSTDSDERLRTFTIITTEANALVRTIHDRMPVILPEGAWDEWLDPRNEDVAALSSLLVPYPAEEMRAYPVSRLVNDVRHDGPELVEPVGAARS
jgi:putative SOS response-associated peptidase YedK